MEISSEPTPRAAARARVGVVLPTYNRARLIGTSIESVLNQDFADWELVIVNDSSTDDTEEVVRRFEARDPRIRMIRNDRYPQSCAGSRQRGVDEVANEFVAFIDSDDRWGPDHLSDLVSCLDQNPDVDWVFGDFRRVDPTGRVLVKSKLNEEWWGRAHFPIHQRGAVTVLAPEGLVENTLRHGIPAGLQASVIRRPVFSKVAFRRVLRADDRLLVTEAVAAGVTFAFSSRNHLDYLVHDANQSLSNPAASFAGKLKVALEIEQYWKHRIPDYVPMTKERRAIARAKLARHLVWELGNNTYRSAGKRWQALMCIGRGIALEPLVPAYWKTWIGTLLGIR